MSKNKGNIKKILISILAPILIVVFIAGSFFAIIDGMVNIVESFLAKVTQIAGEFKKNPTTYLEDALDTFSNWVDKFIPGGDDVFDPGEIGIQGLSRPSILIDQTDFNNIKTNIDTAQVNRDTAGLEDYMLKVMLLSYYRSVYLSDFDILMQITEEEKIAIEKMNDEATQDPNKYPCPFEIVEGDSDTGKGADGNFYLKTVGMIIIETTFEDLSSGNIEVKQLKYYDREVINGLYTQYQACKEKNADYAYSIKEFLKTTYTNSTSSYGEILVPTIDDTQKEIVYNYDDPKIEDYTITEVSEGGLEFSTINYDIVSSKYGTPVEFLLNLLEITESRDFLNAFIAVACSDEYYIKIGLYDLTTRTTNITEETYTQDTEIEGTVDLSVNFEVRFVAQQTSNPGSGYDNSSSDGLTQGGQTIAPGGSNPAAQPGYGIQPPDSYSYTSREYTSRAQVVRSGTLATRGTHYSVTDLSDGTTAITIISGTQTENRLFYLYLGNRSGIVASTITIGDKEGLGWIVNLNYGERIVRKTKNDSNVTVYTTEVINEHSYDTGIKEVNCWWGNIKKERTETELIGYTNVTEDGKTYVETNNMEEHVSIDLIEGLFDESNGYTSGTENINIETESLEKGEHPNTFKLNTTEVIKGKEGLYNQLFNGIINDSNIPYKYGNSDTEHQEIQNLVSENGVTDEHYDYNKITMAYNDAKRKDITIEKTIHSAGGAATGNFNVEKVLALLKDASGNVIEYGDLYNSETGAGEMLENGAEMLFQLLDSSENTEGLSDVMRYILYRYNGKDYGVTSFNFSPYDLEEMPLGSTIIGSSIEDKVWCTLISMGYSPEAVAAVMGNIYAESGFDPAVIESGSGAGFGLCQWTGSRRVQLEAYAAAKGVPASDINTQIEFLVAELTEGGGCNGYAKYQLQTTSYSGTTYSPSEWKNATSVEQATRAFCFTFERPDVDLAHIDTRINKAKEYYAEYNGKTIEEITGTNTIQIKIAEIAKNSQNYGITPRSGYCLAWVNDVYEAAGATIERKDCAYCSGYYFGVSKDFSNVPIGAAIYGESYTALGVKYGHVGIYIGDGLVADNAGYVRISTLEKFISNHPDGCWGWTSSTPVNPSYPVTKGLIHAGRH